MCPCTPGLLYGDERGHGGERGDVAESRRARAVPPLAGRAAARRARLLDGAGRREPRADGRGGRSRRRSPRRRARSSTGTGWDADLVEAAGARVEQMPAIARVGAARSPRCAGYDDCVLEAGTIDAMAEQIVAGADEVGDVLVILGTTLIVWVVTPDPVEGSRVLLRPAHRARARWLVGGPSNAGGLFLDWVDASRAATPGDGRVAARRAGVGAVPARRTGADQRSDAARTARRPRPHARRRRDPARRVRGVGLRHAAHDRRVAHAGAPHRRDRRRHARAGLGRGARRHAPVCRCTSPRSPKAARSAPRSSRAWRPDSRRAWPTRPAGRASIASSIPIRRGSNRRGARYARFLEIAG